MRHIFMYFVSIALLIFSVSALVTFIYSLLVHETGKVDWGTAFLLVIIIGIVLTGNYARDKKRKAKDN